MKLVIFLCALFPALLHAGVVEKARSSLKKYGIAYCLSSHDSPETETEPNLAVGGYFQEGRHDSPQAYKNIKDFFDTRSQDIKIYQTSGKPALLMHCLDLGDSAEYTRFVKKQDKYIGKYSADK